MVLNLEKRFNWRKVCKKQKFKINNNKQSNPNSMYSWFNDNKKLWRKSTIMWNDTINRRLLELNWIFSYEFLLSICQLQITWSNEVYQTRAKKHIRSHAGEKYIYKTFLKLVGFLICTFQLKLIPLDHSSSFTYLFNGF